MSRISKDNYYLNIANVVSSRSTCLKRQYGCVIVNNDEIVSTGYNGSPRDEDNCCDIYEECPRKSVIHNSGDYRTCHAVHAEQNAIISAPRSSMIGGILYLTCHECNIEIEDCSPCPICMRMIKNSGIRKIVTKKGEFELYP